jgi:hypothetical protein
LARRRSWRSQAGRRCSTVRPARSFLQNGTRRTYRHHIATGRQHAQAHSTSHAAIHGITGQPADGADARALHCTRCDLGFDATSGDVATETLLPTARKRRVRRCMRQARVTAAVQRTTSSTSRTKCNAQPRGPIRIDTRSKRENACNVTLSTRRRASDKQSTVQHPQANDQAVRRMGEMPQEQHVHAPGPPSVIRGKGFAFAFVPRAKLAGF